MSTSREARARARRSWPGALRTKQTAAQLSSAEARVLSMWPLTLDTWTTSGLPVPDYERAEMPGRLLQAREPR